VDTVISGKMPRDYRIDFFRGLALISIFVNHIPGNWFSNFTHRNFGLSDAAEVFVLLAGISAALAYYPRFVNGQAGLSIAQIAKRIGTIYIAHLSSIAIGFAVYAGASLWLNQPELLVPDERHWIIDQTVQSLAGIGALTYQTGNFNILPMYIGMLAMLPIIMMLARISLVLALACSAMLWLVANVLHLGPPNYPGSGVWYFNPLTWQLIFTIGFCGGVHLRRGTRVAPSPLLYGAALAYLIAAVLLVMLPLWDRFPVMPEWIWISGFNKSWVGLFRLLHLLALVYVVLCSPIPALLRSWLTHDNWIVSLGRNTLPVFWLSTLLAVIGHIIREDVFMLPNDPMLTATSFAVDCVIVGVGAALLFALALLLDWTKPGAKPRPQLAEGRSPLAVRRLEPAE